MTKHISATWIAKTFYCNDSKITGFEMNDSKKPSTAYVVMYKLIT